MNESKPLTMTPELEDMMRHNTTTGEPDEVHCAGVIAWKNVWGTLDALRARLDGVELERARMGSALRHISATADTLSPQEFINNCASALGVDRPLYAGQCDPNFSLVEAKLRIERMQAHAKAADEGYSTIESELDALRADREMLRGALDDAVHRMVRAAVEENWKDYACFECVGIKTACPGYRCTLHACMAALEASESAGKE